MLKLSWPNELATLPDQSTYRWTDYNANVVLDFHGNPSKAALTVFSDGNHHMALEKCLSLFSERYLQHQDIFYLTLPPAVLGNIIEHSSIQLGNIQLDLQPDVLIGPIEFVNKYHSQLSFTKPVPFAYSLGNSFLYRKQQPYAIDSVKELLRSDARLFLSNPTNEKASYQVYRQTLVNLAQHEGLSEHEINRWLDNYNPRLIYGKRVHHREAPETLFSQDADIALIYHHLALRYTRIYPDSFSLSQFYGSGSAECAKQQIQTHYYICTANQPQSMALQQFFVSPEAGKIYESHGLGVENGPTD